MRLIQDWAEAPGRTAPQSVRRPQHPGVLGDHVTGSPPFNRIGDPLQVVGRRLPQAGQPKHPGSRLALGATLVIRRGGQLVTDPGIRQQPGKPPVGQRHVFVLQASAIEQDGVAAARPKCRELVHDAGPRAYEAVLRRLAELRDRERRHLDAAGRQQCHRHRHLERA